MFQATDTGAYWTVATEKALAYSQGDPTKLAAVALARWLSESGIEYHWNPDTLRFDIDARWQDVEAAPSLCAHPHIVSVTPSAAYTFAVRIAGNPQSPIVCVHGGTYASRWRELIEASPDGVLVSQLLSAADWLRSFPHHWTPCAEVAQAETQAAIAAG